MKPFLLSLALCAQTTCALQAQKNNLPLFFGYKIDLGYNLYQWQEKGNAPQRSVGQVLNVLPTVGGGIWIGRHQWNLSLEAHIDYTPFSLDLQSYSGMGALALPVMVKGGYIWGSKGSGVLFRAGLGTQWNSSEWYALPKGETRPPLHVDFSLLGELSAGLVAGDFRRSHAWSLELFIRLSSNPAQQWGVYTGLRVAFWDTFARYNPSRKRI